MNAIKESLLLMGEALHVLGDVLPSMVFPACVVFVPTSF